MRFLSIYAPAEQTAHPPSAEHMAEMGKFMEETVKAGILVATGGALADAMRFRIRQSEGKTTITDGPFTEAKELIAGFAILDVASKEHAIEIGKRFLQIAGDGQSEYIQLAEMPEPSR